jgi:hypothetical protein
MYSLFPKYVLPGVILAMTTVAWGSEGVGAPIQADGWTAASSFQDEVQDQGFRWLVSDRVRVGFRGGDSIRAERIMVFLSGLPTLPALPDTLPTGLTLFIAPDQSSFDALTGGTVPEWGAGVAIPDLERIVVPGFGSQRTRGWSEARVLQHEWAHLGLHQHLDSLRVPQWFDEGYAEWASGGWNAADGWRLRVAFALGRAPPLDSLALRWPRDRASADLAYLLSATAVEYLIRESGERGLRLFLERWISERSFDAAFRGTYGLTLSQFEEDWKGYVKRRYGWLFVLSHSSVFWLTLALALLAMVRIRRGRDREAMARLRAGEPPDRPTYWEDEPEGTKSGDVRSTEEGESNKEPR